MATETRKSAEAFRQAHSEMFDAGRAFRLNVEQGSQDIGLEEHLEQSAILTATGSYMEFFGCTLPLFRIYIRASPR
jgi:hypothetical protein